MQIVDYIPVGHTKAVTREQLSDRTGLGDRDVRRAIHEARRDTVILNIGGGYYRPDLRDPVDREEVIRFQKQEESRIKSTGWALKSARKMVREIKSMET